MGALRVSEQGISFSEAGKHAQHSRTWKYANIQQLELSSGSLRILTYEDEGWKLGRDREFIFDQLPDGFAQSMYEGWRKQLDQRLVARMASSQGPELWRMPAKLSGSIHGSEGVVIVQPESIVFESSKPGQSRTWRFADLENLASAGPFDLSVVTREHHGTWNAGAREFRFQLKEALPEPRFNELWRRLNSSKQSDFVNQSLDGAIKRR